MVVGRRLQDSILLSSVFGLGHVTFREFQGAAQYSALTNLQVHAYSFRVARLAFFVQHHIWGVEAAARHLLSLPFLLVFGHKSGRQGGKPMKDVEGNLVVSRER